MYECILNSGLMYSLRLCDNGCKSRSLIIVVKICNTNWKKILYHFVYLIHRASAHLELDSFFKGKKQNYEMAAVACILSSKVV